MDLLRQIDAPALDDLVIAVPLDLSSGPDSKNAAHVVDRGEQNSWWKCLRSYPTLLSRSGMPSRSSTFQFLRVVAGEEVFSVYAQTPNSAASASRFYSVDEAFTWFFALFPKSKKMRGWSALGVGTGCGL